jgi:hypothetical protein
MRALAGFAGGLVLFFALAWSLRFSLGSAMRGSVAVSQLVLKGTMIAVAVVVWKLTGRPLVQMGWCRAPLWGRSNLVWYAIGAASMMAGSVAVIFIGARHPVASQMNFLQIVLLIWLLSSFSEEVYVRGLVQSWVEDGASVHSAVAPSVVSSALLFAGMHVPLIWMSAGVKGGLAIVLSTLGVGWACAVLRSRSRSLVPAIVCHILGNVAGVPGGILGVILYRIIYGRLPAIVGAG